MRFLTADYLYPLHRPPLKNGVLQISDKGEVMDIFDNRELVPDTKLEFFQGILSPGFINAHCHLELSHLQGRARKNQGLLNFISSIQKRNNFKQEEILTAIEFAEAQMIKNGIVGVGDICNTNHTIFQKKKVNLEYYNFIEVFGVKNENANHIIIKAKELRTEFRKMTKKATIVPHAPYSVSLILMQQITKSCDELDKLTTIHMQEADAENLLFEEKKGSFYFWLKSMGASSEIWEKRNKSLDILIEFPERKSLLVHNTFIKKEEITSNYYCVCPKANLYIENILPNFSFFDKNKLCVGTDSLASNNNLSILEELQIIKDNSTFDIQTLLKIGSKNGAEALGFEKLGTFEKGKIPGVNLISNFNKVTVIA